jgi:hypothetical protein
MLTLRAPLTGEPDAGNPPVRFGGRGEAHPSSLPLFVDRPCGTGPAATRQILARQGLRPNHELRRIFLFCKRNKT